METPTGVNCRIVGRFRLTLILLATMMPLAAHAEVMDKELSVPQIWHGVIYGMLICVFSAAIWRWLLTASFFFGLFLTGLDFAWTEWFDPYVGPGIRDEAGPHWGVHIIAAITILTIAHIIAWFLSSRLSLVNHWRVPPDLKTPQGRKHTFIYAVTILLITALAACSGFVITAQIWLSPPVLIAVIFLGWATSVYRRTARMISEVQPK